MHFTLILTSFSSSLLLFFPLPFLLSFHPISPQVGQRFYIVAPICAGGELYQHIVDRGYFSEEDALVVIRDLCSALHALHSRGMLHLDIKVCRVHQ